MPANIEIKARAKNFKRQCQLAAKLSGTSGELLEQEDLFFHSPRGRLKLRIFSAAHGELIYYEREDVGAPKPSKYLISPTSEPMSLKATLAAAFGVRGVVRKQRWLYLIGNTRIHLDTVAGLGNFIELEYVLSPVQVLEEGVRATRALMRELAIDDGDLVEKAYVDLLELC